MFEKLETQIEKAGPLDFGVILNQSIALFKNVWLQGVITILLTLGLILPFYLIIYVPFFAFEVFDPEAMRGEVGAHPLVMLPLVILFLIFMFFATAIAIGFKAGFYRICKQKDLNLQAPDDFFYYFKKPYFVKLLQLAAVTIGISVISMSLCVFPVIYVSVPLSFFAVIFAFHPELSVRDVVVLSFKLGHKKWLLTFGLLIICGILAQIVGLILCIVGVLVTASFAYLPLYFICKHVFGFEKIAEEFKER